LDPFGPIQVQISVLSKKIQTCTVVQYPTSGESGIINPSATKKLCQEAVTANSAKVAAVSGATYTTKAFIDSLSSALTLAGM
jgi:uncharacterized protein with FMN-binding domain